MAVQHRLRELRRPGHRLRQCGPDNTGNWNSSGTNTGVGITTDSGLPNSGYGNVGSDISGFFNTAGGGAGTNGWISGFFNTVTGGSFNNFQVSGVGNHIVPDSPLIILFGTSGYASGLFNTSTTASGIFDLSRRLG